jgi:hypothetical protein
VVIEYEEKSTLGIGFASIGFSVPKMLMKKVRVFSLLNAV